MKSMHTEKKKEIVFSVITPNYNSGKKLLRAINSLRNNNITFEHIIIDDCSTDDSFFSIKELEDSESDLVLITNSSNMGPGKSRNKGLELARGQYIIFLDADDYFLENALDNLYFVIKSKEEIDILLFNYYMIIDIECNLDFLINYEKVSLVSDPVREYLLDSIISSPWCKCVKADLAKSFRFPDLKVSEDAIYNLDIFMNASTVYQIDSILYIFDKTESNSLTRKIFDRTEFMKFHKGWVFFERKVLREISMTNRNELLASRKIKFNVLYYISRMAINSNNKIDKFIVGSIRKTIRKNIKLAGSELNKKIKLLCFMFYFFPSLTVKLVRFYKIL